MCDFGDDISGSAFQHNSDDFFVGICHAVASKRADIADGVFYTFCNQTLAGVKLIAVFVHCKSQQTCVNRGCNLCGTACFCTVTDYARVHGKSIYNCVGYCVVSAALKESNTCGSSASSTHNSAVGRKSADACFKVDCNKV